MSDITPSYALANQELVESFVRYLESRHLSRATIRAYHSSCQLFIESLGAANVVEATRADVRIFLNTLLERGLADSSINHHTIGLRSFYKFITSTGLTRHNPMLLIAKRKLAFRMQYVPPLSDIEAMIAAARDPFESAVIEVLYGTGVRISEFVNLKTEDIIWDGDGGSIRVKNGKGGKDRVERFGSYAAKAIREYLSTRKRRETAGYLFEAPARVGMVHRRAGRWYGRIYIDQAQRDIALGSITELPTPADALARLHRLGRSFKGFSPLPARPYPPEAIRGVLRRLAHRAGVKYARPHDFRRAFGTHLLVGGADLRAVQELLGHSSISSTMPYTKLSAHDLMRVYESCHPHAKGADHGEQ